MDTVAMVTDMDMEIKDMEVTKIMEDTNNNTEVINKTTDTKEDSEIDGEDTTTINGNKWMDTNRLIIPKDGETTTTKCSNKK